MIVSQLEIEVVDFKSGHNQVLVKNNEQLEQYALGAINYFKDDVVGLTQGSVKMTIIQPPMAFYGKDVITSHSESTIVLENQVLNKLIEEREVVNSSSFLNPGEKQCRYCPVKGNCSALANKVNEIMELEPVKSDDLSHQAAMKDPSDLTNEQLVQVFEASPLIKKFMEGVEEEISTRITSGQMCRVYKVVKGFGQACLVNQ